MAELKIIAQRIGDIEPCSDVRDVRKQTAKCPDFQTGKLYQKQRKFSRSIMFITKAFFRSDQAQIIFWHLLGCTKVSCYKN
jgi:hypothetical protein